MSSCVLMMEEIERALSKRYLATTAAPSRVQPAPLRLGCTPPCPTPALTRPPGSVTTPCRSGLRGVKRPVARQQICVPRPPGLATACPAMIALGRMRCMCGTLARKEGAKGKSLVTLPTALAPAQRLMMSSNPAPSDAFPSTASTPAAIQHLPSMSRARGVASLCRRAATALGQRSSAQGLAVAGVSARGLVGSIQGCCPVVLALRPWGLQWRPSPRLLLCKLARPLQHGLAPGSNRLCGCTSPAGPSPCCDGGCRRCRCRRHYDQGV